ncbi:MAG: type II secretion system protein [Balneolaceae bacterium]
MVQRIIKEEDGYTLIEILIAILVVSIILSVASTVFVFANQQLKRWSDNMEFYTSVHIAKSQFYRDMMRGEQIMFTDSSVVIQNEFNRTRTYSWKGGKMTLNGNQLANKNIDSLYIIPSMLSRSSQDSMQIISWQMIQKAENSTWSHSQQMYIRKPIYWESLRD